MNEQMRDLIEHPTLGVLRLDYDYPPALGDIDNPASFSYPVVYRVVPGLTFQMAQKGVLTKEVQAELKEAIRYLVEERHVSAITGDCGFMMWFEHQARQLSSVPVFLSALMQLPSISASLCKENDKIIVMTANVNSLRPMRGLINEVTGSMEEDMHFEYVGCEDVPHFGYEVEHGLQVNVAKAQAGILAKAKEAVANCPSAKAILLECTELPPYADALRAELGLPVYDSITNADFVMNAFLDNERFGITHWYKEWDGTQESYMFGQHLTPEQRSKLVSKPIMTDKHAMQMIMKELEKTSVDTEFRKIGLNIDLEDIAHAIAVQVEAKQVAAAMSEIQNDMKRSKKSRIKKPFKRVREFLNFVHGNK